jgi:hypothetical protein
MEETCMFCLETLKQNEMAFNPIGCQCQFKSHGPCLQSWFNEKQQYECPICHAVSVPNPVQSQVHIIYIQQDPIEIERERGESLNERRITQAQKKCVALCCLGWIFWSLSITLIDLHLGR